jgi:signal transduction histidine kinase
MEGNNIIPLVLAGSVLITVFAFFLIGFLVVHKSRQARARRKLAEYGNRLLQTRIEVQEATARSISAELHDNVGAMLSHIKMQLQFLTEAEGCQDLRPELVPLYTDLGTAITGLRRISHTLNGDMIGRIGLAEALRRELAGIERRGKMIANLQIEGTSRLSAEQELLLFRIAQEAVANAVKHSGASVLQVQLQQVAGRLRLSITDNGRGVGRSGCREDTAHGGNGNTGMGMMNMAERAKMLGATFTVNTPEDGGVAITIELDMPANGTKNTAS